MRHGWASDQWHLQEDICTAAKDLHDFLGKVLTDNPDGPLKLVGEDIYAEGVTDRLQRLQDALFARQQAGNMPISPPETRS